MAVCAVLVAARLAIPPERDRLWPCAVAFSLGWVWYLAAWLTYSPAHILNLTSGVAVAPWKLWAAADAVVGFYVFTKAWDREWGVGLFMLFVVQEFIHLWLGEASSVDPSLFPAYSSMLDGAFAAQVACLLFAGGSGVRMRIIDAYGRWRMRHVAQPSKVREAVKDD